MPFEVIMVDCPWEFRNKKTGGNHTSGAAQQYPTMKLGELMKLPVASIAAPNASLFLWTPTRLKFSHAQPLATAWGFTSYETTIYWDKERLGMGFWYRGQVEELLVFTRGDVKPYGCQLPNIVRCRAGEHSEKPEEFRRRIEAATGQASSRRNLEVFARKTVAGWTGIGNQVTGNDVRTDLKHLYLAQRAAPHGD